MVVIVRMGRWEGEGWVWRVRVGEGWVWRVSVEGVDVGRVPETECVCV